MRKFTITFLLSSGLDWHLLVVGSYSVTSYHFVATEVLDTSYTVSGLSLETNL